MDIRKLGATSNIIRFILKNSSTGLPLTGLTYSSSGLIISTICNNESSATAYTVAASNVETISTLGTFAAPSSGKCRFKEVDATNHPGLYEIQIADARFNVSSAKNIVISVSGATNLLTEHYLIELVSVDLFDSVRMGLTALPNATAGANGGLPLAVDSSGRVDVLKINGTSQTARDIGSSVLLAADQAVNVTKWKGATAPDMTGDAYARIGANGAGLTAIPWNAAWDAEVQSECADALAAYDPPTNAEMEARTLAAANYATASSQTTIAGYIDTEIAAILAAVDTEIAAIKAKTDNLPSDPADQSAVEAAITAATSPLATSAALGAVDDYIDAEVAAIKAVTDKLDTALELDNTVYRFTTNALENSPTGSGGFTSDDRTKLEAILEDTAAIGANGAGLTAIPWNTAWDAEVQSECADALAAYDPPTNAEMEARTLIAANYATATGQTTIAEYIDTEIAAILAAVDTEIAAIKAKTDNLPTDPADQSAVEAAITAATSPLATSAALDAVDNYIDTEVAAIKAVTDKIDTALELDSTVYRFTANALEQVPTGGGSSLTVQDIVDGVLDELLSAHRDVGSVGAGIAAAGSAGDPWSTALPGAYEDGTAGYIIGNNMPSPGSGSTPWPYLLTDAATGQPIAGVAVRVSTDAAGTVTVAAGTTDANGYVTFNLDPGTYYIWRTKTGYTFSNPDTEVIT